MNAVLESLIQVLAALGAAGLLLRAAGSIARMLLGAAENAAASGVADVSARRGDLTGMQEARHAAQAARGVRRRSAVMGLVWACWLVVPLVMGWLPEPWVLAAPLWILPQPSWRRLDPQSPSGPEADRTRS